MCGIFCAFGKSLPEKHAAKLTRAVEVVSHRGPDNMGFFSDDACFLGHTRLSIIGIEASGNQPFMFENLAMTFNGEIFNYIELREELSALGYSFVSNSDTEVVLKAFHKWGSDSFSRLNGMWSLVIYDRLKKTVTACRDRFGQKPLFVLKTTEGIYFASEFQQLVPLSSGRIDYALIQAFLKEGTYEGGGRTFMESIEEFPKAHYCEVDLSGNCTSTRFWDYPVGNVKSVTAETFTEFEALLKDSVRLRLRADVPFGVLLSGGVDSTVIAAYAAEFTENPADVPAFTYSSGDADDETRFAKAVADELGMPLSVRVQDTDPANYIGRLREIVRNLGRGHSSPAIVSVDYLYESVRQADIKVVLDGQGADELLAGYKNYFALVIPWYLMRGKFKQAWLCLKDQFDFGFLLAIVLFLRNVMPASIRSLMRRAYGYERFFRRVDNRTSDRIVTMHVTPGRNANALNRYLIWHHNLGLENLLFYGDIIAMKNSVENRSPFMDHRLVDFVLGRSEELKLYNAIDKYGLRTLPLYKRFRSQLERKKVGFSSDIRAATKRRMIGDLRTSAILSWPIFKGALADFLKGDGIAASKYERFLFRLYQVHLWHSLFAGLAGEREERPALAAE